MDPLTASLAAKIQEQVELTVQLIGRIEDPEWRPPISAAWSFGKLLGHLLDCLAGVCAVLYAVDPERLPYFTALRDLPVNRACGPMEALERIEIYAAHIEEGFAALRDADLSRGLPTVFVAEGELVLTLLLGNLEHLINHKHQLFLYLKLAAVNVGTADLYRFRG